MNGCLCGHSDPALNLQGRTQASALASQLREWNVRRLYSSDLRRAVQTAEPLAQTWGLPIVARSALREISFGEWEGRRWAEIRAIEPEITSLESNPAMRAPGGETFPCFRQRVLQLLREIISECNWELTAIVTHLGVIRVALAEFSSTTWAVQRQQRIDLCSVHRIFVSGTSIHDLGDNNLRSP
jgi:broad specificity phosphatase PhoE